MCSRIVYMMIRCVVKSSDLIFHFAFYIFMRCCMVSNVVYLVTLLSLYCYE